MKTISTRALLLATAVAFAPAAYAETPADTLVVAAQIDDIISLDPAQSFEFSGNDVTKNLYDKLVDFDPLDLDKGVQPELAESWEVSEDGKTITFTIRDGAKFQSGNPVRAEDAAWSIQRAVKLDKSPAFILNQFGLSADNVDQMVRADGNKLIFEMDKPYAVSFVLNCLSASVASVVDKETALANAQGDDLGNGWLSTNSAGSGPWVLAQWRPNEALSLTANADHWAGAPKLNRVIIRNVQESATQRLLLERGDVDVARNLNPSDVGGVEDNAALKVNNEERGKILYMGLNQKDPLLSNPAVVQAMKHLVDYDGISGSFLKGQFTPHQSFLPAGYLGAVNDLPWDYNVEKARQILTEAGITSGTVTTRVRDIPEYVNTAQALQGAMAQVGLTLNIEQMTGAQVLDGYRAREVPIFIGEWGPDYADPQTNAGTFAWNPDNSDEARLTGSLAWRNAYAVPQAMNDAVAAAVTEGDTAKREQMYRDIQVEYQNSAPIVPLFQKIEQAVMQANIQNWSAGGSVTDVSYAQVTKGE
ncbi:MAG: ABC transporter substrate-binding protein [Paracoccus sp. (in: a-proteobacteria)]|uniref:ABC transporter substrate-binding protein n=1 Tax=Paracoccus sp. TaxID=267 RepID=UPI0026E0EA8F|nr:ABC transporter substrate-binding protein [Paracoccus sp. (in: a-proteobacteria)]MDO5621832.1 ABC transporter substrate-binding protein [Paracoccus sp. (in: a-proteobacteria)]